MYNFVRSFALILITDIFYILFEISFPMTGKSFLDIRTAITNLDLEVDFYSNESEALDTLLSLDQALILDTLKRKRLDKEADVQAP